MDFQTLTRRELQLLCKINKIAANQTNAAMANALKALDIVQGMEEVISKPSQSESAQSSIESPEKTEVTSPSVPRTGRRTSVRRKPPVREVSASVPAPTRSALGGARRKIVVGATEKANIDVPETPAAAPNSRKRLPAASTRRKLVSQLKESEDPKTGDEADLLDKKDVPKTPAVAVSSRRRGGARQSAVEEETTVQRVYSTRRSVRLSEKKVVESNPKEAKGHESTKIHSFSKEMDDTLVPTLDYMGEVSVNTSVPGGDSQKIPEDSLDTTVDSGVLLALKSNVSSEAVTDVGDCVMSSEVDATEKVEDAVTYVKDCVQMSIGDFCEVDDVTEKMEDNLDAVDESDVASVSEAQFNSLAGETHGETENKYQNGEDDSETDDASEDDSETGASEDDSETDASEDDSGTDASEDEILAKKNFGLLNLGSYPPRNQNQEAEGELFDMNSGLSNEENSGGKWHDVADVDRDAVQPALDLNEATDAVIVAEFTSDNDLDTEMPLTKKRGMEVAVDVSVQQNLIGNEVMAIGPGYASEMPLTCELPPSSDEETADQLQGQAPSAGLLDLDIMTRSIHLTPSKKSASETPTANKRMTCISDDKENIRYSGGRAFELTKDNVNKNITEVAEDDMQKALQEKSLRQLEKMLKEKLQLRNCVKDGEENDIAKVPKTRPALQMLSENHLLVDGLGKDN